MKAEPTLINPYEIRRMSAREVSQRTMLAVETIRVFRRVETVRDFVKAIYTYIEVTKPQSKASSKAKLEAMGVVSNVYDKYFLTSPSDLLERCVLPQLRYAVGTYRASRKAKLKALRIVNDMVGYKLSISNRNKGAA